MLEKSGLFSMLILAQFTYRGFQLVNGIALILARL